MKTLTKGNDAIAQAAIKAGCKAYFGYPITPQSEIPEYMAAHLEKAGGVFVQAESEVAAINMVFGAAAAGIRVMTSSSSPGMALKQEGISYMVGADLPCVIANMSRGGPGLGNILPSQSDYLQATRGGGNGDYCLPVLAPNSVQEASDLVQKAFNLADKYRTPVIVLGDGILGQMMEGVEVSDIPQIDTDKSWAANGKMGERGKRNIVSSIYSSPQELEELSVKRFERYQQIRDNEQAYERQVQDGDQVVIVAYGIPSRIALNAIQDLKEQNIKTGLIRPITLWPYPDKAFENLPSSVKAILVIELSMGQMVDDVRLAVNSKYPVHFYGRTGGMVFEPDEIVDKVKQILGEKK